jgi:hypothetical protein
MSERVFVLSAAPHISTDAPRTRRDAVLRSALVMLVSALPLSSPHRFH